MRATVGELLVALAVGHEDRLDGVERARDARAVQPPHERARDDEAARGRAELVEQRAPTRSSTPSSIVTA